MRYKWWISSILLVITCASWALASPLGSSSDDDFHLANIWCSHGIREGQCEYSQSKNVVRVPLPIAQAGICYLGDNEKSASCTNDELRSGSKTLVQSPRSLSDNRVSLFYWLNGMFVGPNIELSIIAMRLFNIVIILGLFYLVRRSASEILLSKFVLTLIVTAVPSALFLINSNNSSSWTFLGGGFAWFFAHQTVVEDSRRKQIIAINGLIIASLLGMGSRSENAVFIPLQICFISVLAILSHHDRGRVRRALMLCTTSIIFGTVIYTHSNAKHVVLDGFLGADDETPIIRIGRHVLFSNLLSVSELYTGLLGGLRGIGGSLTELPGTVRTLTTFALGFVIVDSIKDIRRKTAIYLVVLSGVITAIPLYILQKNQLLVGEELVPRYLYPLLALFVGSIVLVSSSQAPISRGPRVALTLFLGIANSISLRTMIHRHTHGIDQYGIFNLNSNREWWWQSITTLQTPMTVWVLGSLSFFFLILISLKPFESEDSRAFNSP